MASPLKDQTVAKKLVENLQTDLRGLSAEAKKKHPNIKEKNTVEIEDNNCKNEGIIAGLIPASAEIVQPFVMGCDTKNSKIMQICLGGVQRLISHEAVSMALVLCFRLHFAKDSTTINTAAATIKQLVSIVFERVLSEDRVKSQGNKAPDIQGTPPALVGGMPVGGGVTPQAAFMYRGVWIPLAITVPQGQTKSMFTDESATEAVLKAMKTYANLCGQLEMTTPRDAFITALCKASLPPHYTLTVLNSQSIAQSSQKAKNIQCMRSLLSVAHCHGGILGTAWHLVLTTLQEPSLFAVAKLLETGLVNLSRVEVLWRPVTAHLLELRKSDLIVDRERSEKEKIHARVQPLYMCLLVSQVPKEKQSEKYELDSFALLSIW
ncbi:Protein MON2 homolog [Mytilus edulis]|uniref:Protein MON2 homolog n=1 Tax=Mytilus edulis TaxID=6550 RepID=A0A8S3U3J3_MYTED|nr:Protein MON2 homolog [Mytilus edulis]